MPIALRIWTRPMLSSPHGPRPSARWRCSRPPSGTASLAPRCAMSTRSCTTRTCTSAVCSNGSTMTRSAVLSSRPRRCGSTAPTKWRRHPAPSLASTMPKFTEAGSDCHKTRSPNSDGAAARLRENLAEPPDRAQHPLLGQPRPLTTHDEVVHTQKLAIPRDLLLHRPFVADDEPVARKIFERAMGAAVRQSPRRIGIVFVFQWPAALLMRGRMAVTDIAFDGDREFHRGPAILLQCRAIGLHQWCHLAEPAGIDDQPGVADPRRPPDRHIGLCGDVDRRAARAHRLGADAGVVDGVESALVAHPVLGP